MPKFQVYCTWTMDGIVEVEAPDLESAITEVELNGELPEGTYLDSSFEVVREITEDLNMEAIESASEGDS